MIHIFLLVFIFLFSSCNTLSQQKDTLSEDFIEPDFSITFFGSYGKTKYDSIKVGWTAIEKKDEMGHIIYPKAVNTMTDCRGNQKTIVAGNSSYPSFRVDDCPNNEYFFKLKNSTGDSMVYRIPFDFDSSFYAQKFDFDNGGRYRKHNDLIEFGKCTKFEVGAIYSNPGQGGLVAIQYDYDEMYFNIPSVDSVSVLLAKDLSQIRAIDYIYQVCDISAKNKLNQPYSITYSFKYIN